VQAGLGHRRLGALGRCRLGRSQSRGEACMPSLCQQASESDSMVV
jgi:hypothetical protein